jgi:hypothetical protein
MDAIEAAIAAIESREIGDETSYSKVAAIYGVSRSTLSRRHRGSQHPKEVKDFNQQAFSPQQECELVVYIEKLTEQGLPPTREMIINFASQVAHRQVSETWVTRFINRHSIHLISRWSTGIDSVRHQADSGYKYKLYFDLLHHKIEEYEIEQSNTYNMDEKGFMIGVLGRSKRVFSKNSWVKKSVRAPTQDGNKEWITVLACICADGSALPPSLIYRAKSGAIRDTWVEDITSGDHSVHVTSSPTGWTNNDIGLSWLKQVFDRYTKEKCRRSWRLLILDGHGSHITLDFLEYCDQNRILLAIFPSHSTYTLQPLDVVMFKPLSSAYSAELAYHQQQALRRLPIKKGDFFPLFWSAWIKSFKKETILKSFEATGIWPMDAEVILKRFSNTPTLSTIEQRLPSRLSPTDWFQMKQLLQSVIQDKSDNQTKQLSASLHHLQVQNELLKYENKGLKASLNTKKKRKKHSKALLLEQSGEYHGGAVLYSPKSVQRARDKAATIQQEEEEEHLQNLQRKKKREEAQLEKQLQVRQRREEREKAKALKEKEKAEKAAERERLKEERNAAKALKLSQSSKRKALQVSSPNKKRQKRVGAAHAPVQVQDEPSPPPSTVTSRGRNVNLPKKFR